MAALRSSPWPGNIRELRNTIERAVIFGRDPLLGTGDLPEVVAQQTARPQLGDRVTLSQIERIHIRRVVASTASLQEAAEVLGIDPATLWRKRQLYGL